MTMFTYTANDGRYFIVRKIAAHGDLSVILPTAVVVKGAFRAYDPYVDGLPQEWMAWTSDLIGRCAMNEAAITRYESGGLR